MSKKPTIESLCRKYKNEDAHSRFVAGLSLQIFDAMSRHLKLPASLRPTLRAAALLHDIGYFQKPSDHQAQGMRIVMKKGVAGFTDEQCRTIAAIILLHRKDYTKAYFDRFFKNLDNKVTALRLGAILRVADGLDHGHVQNTSILSVKNRRGGTLLSVSSPTYRGNIAWARAKADLWKNIFPKELRIVESTRAEAAGKFFGIVRPGDGVLDAARRLLYLQYRIVAEQYGGMLTGESDEPLHDARVALRRLRSCLRLFAPFLPAKTCRAIDEKIASIALALSPVRDNDVWRAFLFSRRMSDRFRGSSDFVHFCALQSRMKKADQQALRKILAGREYTALMRHINRFLRIELPQKSNKPQVPLAPFAGRRLAALYFEVLSRPGVKPDYDVKQMHHLRKLCRRGRYWSEFFAPVLGRPAALFARRFKALADTLGDLHDTDMALLRLRQQDSPAAPQLLLALSASKRVILAAFRRSWRSLRMSSMLYAAAALFGQGKSNAAFLHLVRHATAAATGGEKRRLDTQGIREAQTAGRALSLLQCRPGVLASSPLARAHDTAAVLAQNFSFNAPVTKKQCLLPDADVADTLAWLKTIRQKSAVCVGHMPHLAHLSKALLKSGRGAPVEFKRASACCISFAGKMEPGKGALEWYFTQRKMKRIVERITGKL